jgi:sugar transferase EpsL
MYFIAKRILDIAVAFIGVVLLIPIMALVALAIRIALHEPAIFRQLRVGRGERTFLLLKFRTMLTTKDTHGHMLPDAARLTPLGRFLRKNSVDELPQLWNVLRGDMSLVGPRPLLPHYLPRYNAHQRRRHEVKPGITGWAQVNGRNSLTWKERFDQDVWYVDHCGIWLDLKILYITFLRVFRREGIIQPGHATMPEFMGNERI